MVNYILLGVIQGLTEFLPVSSSAHLIIFQKLLGISEDQVVVAIALHLGTACSLLIYFSRDILGALRNVKLIARLSVTTLVTAAIVFLGKDFFEGLFSSTVAVAFALFITGIVLIGSKKIMPSKKQAPGLIDSFVTGLAQGVAVIPGISRSGITITSLLFLRVDKMEAFRYSFLAAIPVIFGAAILKFKQIDLTLTSNPAALISGFLTSFFVGLVSLHLLEQVLRKAKLHYFGYYCIIIAVAVLVFLR